MFGNSNKKKKRVSASMIDTLPISTVIGGDVLFTGDIAGESMIRIEGRVEGNVRLGQGIVLGEKALLKGDLESETVVNYGTVNGNIVCKELVIKSTGVVNGNIHTESIEIEMGGRYNGMLDMHARQNNILETETATSKNKSAEKKAAS